MAIRRRLVEQLEDEIDREAFYARKDEDLFSLEDVTELLQIRKLGGPERLYRIRFGDYRLLYTVESFGLVVIVIKIGRRRDIYR